MLGDEIIVTADHYSGDILTDIEKYEPGAVRFDPAAEVMTTGTIAEARAYGDTTSLIPGGELATVKDAYTESGILSRRSEWVVYEDETPPHRAAEFILANAWRSFRFDQENDQWYQWNGQSWRKMRGTATQQARTVATWARKAMEYRTGEGDGEYGQWKPTSGSRTFDFLGADTIARSLLDLARADTARSNTVIHPWDKETRAHEYWGGDVLWDLHESADLMALVGPCDEDDDRNPYADITHLDTHVLPANASTAGWDAWLATVLPNPADRMTFMCAASLGLVAQSVRGMVIFLGDTGTGKTATMKMLMHLFGDYAKVIPAATLFGKNADPQRAAAELTGVRAAFVDEGITRWSMNDEVLKMVTGGQSHMNARKLYAESEQVRATHTVFFSVNPGGLPNLADEAIVDRICLVPFSADRVTVAEAAAAYNVDSEQFRAEAPGILGQIHMVAGLILKGMIKIPDTDPSLMAKARAVQAAETTVGMWLAACGFGGQEVAVAELYGDYVRWCADNRVKAVSKPQFGRDLSLLGMSRRKSHGTVLWHIVRGEIES